MAFDAEALPALNPLAFVTTSGALDAYRLARLTDTPGAYREAAHKLAAALQQARPAPARPVLRVWIDQTDGGGFAWGYDGGPFQFSGFPTALAAREDCLATHPTAAIRWVDAEASRLRAEAHEAWCSGQIKREFALTDEADRVEARAASGPARRARKPKPDGLDLAAPSGAVPKTKRIVGAFVCRWADGSETRVSGVIYHAAKPELRWASAFQAADRLRRMRAGSALGRAERFIGRYVEGPCGVLHNSAEWLALERARPMAELAEMILCENSADVHQPTGVYGAGDAAEAERLEAVVRRVRERPARTVQPFVKPEPAGVVVQLRPVAAVQAALAERARAIAAHLKASEAFGAAFARTNPDPAEMGRLYDEQCLAFALLREAERAADRLAA